MILYKIETLKETFSNLSKELILNLAFDFNENKMKCKLKKIDMF